MYCQLLGGNPPVIFMASFQSMLPKRHAVGPSQGDVTLPFDKVVCEETYFHGKQFLRWCDSKRPENDFVKKTWLKSWFGGQPSTYLTL